MRLEKSRDDGRNTLRKGYGHFGTSTREGVLLQSFDANDSGLRLTHVPADKDGVPKKRINQAYKGPPGPGVYYQFCGDFDFEKARKDPEDKITKTAKQWSFGLKPTIKARNLDVPGVGNVEVDQAPLWMKNPQYWIGTDVRKDFARPNAHLYPGPGQYHQENSHELPIGGPEINFGKDPKKTSIEKTFLPGPATYHTYGTVGNVRGYLKEEKNPRVPATKVEADE